MNANSLWNAFAEGDANARDALLAEHLGLVHFVARQLSRKLSSEADFDELLSAGTLGLIGAMEGFDVARGLAFSTFAARSSMSCGVRITYRGRSGGRRASSALRARSWLTPSGGRPLTASWRFASTWTSPKSGGGRARSKAR